MRVGIITATSGDRPYLFDRCLFYIERQTVKPTAKVFLSGEESLKEKCRKGLEQLKNEVDLIFFFEDDDYYPPNYIEKMLELYEWAGNPEIFGIGETYFYHPEFKAMWYYKNQDYTACAFQTCVRSDAVDKIDWSRIDDVFVDAGLWRQLNGQTVELGKPLSIGIKHGRGKTLASGHNIWFFDEKCKISSDTEYAMFDDEWIWDQIGNDAVFYDEFGERKDLV